MPLSKDHKLLYRLDCNIIIYSRKTHNGHETQTYTQIIGSFNPGGINNRVRSSLLGILVRLYIRRLSHLLGLLRQRLVSVPSGIARTAACLLGRLHISCPGSGLPSRISTGASGCQQAFRQQPPFTRRRAGAPARQPTRNRTSCSPSVGRHTPRTDHRRRTRHSHATTRHRLPPRPPLTPN